MADTNRVTTLELFFDLVFVFTITQLTAVLYHAPTLRSLLQVVLMLGAIWWMYGGYAWMTNAVSANTTNRRLLLLGGMGGYFVLALAIPHAFTSSGLAFGIAFVALLGLGLSACLWWLYFGTGTEPAERALDAMPPVRRARAALNAYGYAHLPILLGIVTVAAAERDGFAHPSHSLTWFRAALLAGGVALYLAGDVLLRWELGIGRG